MSIIEMAVIHNDGKWPCGNYNSYTIDGGARIWRNPFEHAARRMGYINGYKFMKEYSGEERPNLPDDVIVSVLTHGRGRLPSDRSDSFNWASSEIKSFRVVDDRYSPSAPEPTDETDIAADGDINYMNMTLQDVAATFAVPVRMLTGNKSEHIVDASEKAGPLNGYEWGKEYPTNGKKPGLPDDILVQIKHDGVKDWLSPERVDYWCWTNHLKGEVFRITDQRYKPEPEQTEPAQSGLQGYFQYGVEMEWDGRGSFPTMMTPDCLVEVRFRLGNHVETGNAGRFNWMMVKRYKVIDDRYKPAPTKPWFEAGDLPPVGVVCEMQTDVADEFIWVEIIAKKDGFCFGWSSSRRQVYFSSDRSEFRPIRTEREKFGMSLWRAINFNDQCTDYEILSSSRFEDYCKPFDIGFKAPESK